MVQVRLARVLDLGPVSHLKQQPADPEGLRKEDFAVKSHHRPTNFGDGITGSAEVKVEIGRTDRRCGRGDRVEVLGAID